MLKNNVKNEGRLSWASSVPFLSLTYNSLSFPSFIFLFFRIVSKHITLNKNPTVKTKLKNTNRTYFLPQIHHSHKSLLQNLEKCERKRVRDKMD